MRPRRWFWKVAVARPSGVWNIITLIRASVIQRASNMATAAQTTHQPVPQDRQEPAGPMGVSTICPLTHVSAIQRVSNMLIVAQTTHRFVLPSRQQGRALAGNISVVVIIPPIRVSAILSA